MVKIKGKKTPKKAPSDKTILVRNKRQDKAKKVKKKPAIKSKKNPELSPKNASTQNNTGSSFLLSKNQLYKLQKQWDKILKEDGFNDIEFRQSNLQSSEYIKKPLYERNHKKISAIDIKEHIEAKTERLTAYRHYYYDGKFESFFDKFIWYCYYQIELPYKKIISLIQLLRAKHPKLKQILSIPGPPEITKSLNRSRKLKDILFP